MLFQNLSIVLVINFSMLVKFFEKWLQHKGEEVMGYQDGALVAGVGGQGL